MEMHARENNFDLLEEFLLYLTKIYNLTKYRMAKKMSTQRSLPMNGVDSTLLC